MADSNAGAPPSKPRHELTSSRDLGSESGLYAQQPGARERSHGERLPKRRPHDPDA